MLLFTPSQLPRQSFGPDLTGVIRQLCDAVCEHWGARGVHLGRD